MFSPPIARVSGQKLGVLAENLWLIGEEKLWLLAEEKRWLLAEKLWLLAEKARAWNYRGGVHGVE